MELLMIKPVFKEAILGGKKLREVFHYTIPSDKTGECWAISGHPNGEGSIDGGSFDGMKLGTLWKDRPELFGHYPGNQFPLLVKIIDAQQDLSIQSWDKFIRKVPVKKGDFFQIDPGCLHAIKGGTLILETQQSSDITYRVYDYDRLSDGKPRPLHVEQSIATINAPFVSCQGEIVKEELCGAVHTHLITCPYYSVDKYEIHGEWETEFASYFTNVSVLEGEGTVDGVPVKKGCHFILPHRYGSCKFRGELSIICSSPEKA